MLGIKEMENYYLIVFVKSMCNLVKSLPHRGKIQISELSEQRVSGSRQMVLLLLFLV